MDVIGFLNRASEKTGFVRETHQDERIPTSSDRIAVMPFFGDLRSLFVLSSLLLKRFREEERGSKYFILASWPGFQALFPYVDEYWSLADTESVPSLYESANQLRNDNPLASSYYRNLNQYFFEDMMTAGEAIGPYYDNGITNAFWDRYKQVRRTLPGVPSSAVLGKDFNRELQGRGGMKVFVYPSLTANLWDAGVSRFPVRKEFWVSLVERLLKERFLPVVYRGVLTHDISPDFTNRCVYCADRDVGKVLATMRATGCVLDIYSGVSRLAIAARCPFVAVDERSRYAALKEYEIDDLCGPGLPKQYIFSFPTILHGEPESWDQALFNNIVARLHAFLPDLNREEWPPTGGSTEAVPYEGVRNRKARRIGTRLLKVSRD